MWENEADFPVFLHLIRSFPNKCGRNLVVWNGTFCSMHQRTAGAFLSFTLAQGGLPTMKCAFTGSSASVVKSLPSGSSPAVFRWWFSWGIDQTRQYVALASEFLDIRQMKLIEESQ